jgi:hypothetical protein
MLASSKNKGGIFNFCRSLVTFMVAKKMLAHAWWRFKKIQHRSAGCASMLLTLTLKTQPCSGASLPNAWSGAEAEWDSTM